MNRVSPPLKTHGGKNYLATKIVGLMAPHTHFVEPYFGGGAVLLAKDPIGVSEVVNDINLALTNFWRVIQSPALFSEFYYGLECCPFSEWEWITAGHALTTWKRAGSPIPDVSAARAFFVRCRQSMAGRMKDFAPLSRTRTRAGVNEQASAWMSAVDGLYEVHIRMRPVVVLCGCDALKVIRQQDGLDVLMYLDHPYLQETRTSPDVYDHEMSREDHERLLDLLTTGGLRGKFLISGYDSPLYRRKLSSWNRHSFDLPNNAAAGTSKRRMTELLWMNY